MTLSQKHLRNRVSYTQLINSASHTYPASATYYSYDVHGNVDTLLQDFGNSSGIANAMNQSGNRFKKIVYAYDLISGKVNQVSYQPGMADAYYHRYEYDAENRLTDVYSGRDSVMLTFFAEREAHYNYYKHGPLAQTLLGQLQVQTQDYAYTLQGWLKAVNPDSSIAGVIAKNVYSYVLNYYNNDYTGIGAPSPSAGIATQLAADNKPLYNGNISSMGVNIPRLGNSMLYNFQYDQLNRLVAMDAWASANSAWGTLTKGNDYKERLSYDPNGNILTYLRNGPASSLNVNNYAYSYQAGNNRLATITNSVNATTGTYSYDDIGNVVKDDKQGISTASWNVYGKLQSATKTNGTQISYSYNAGGSRALKTAGDTTEAYVRDASGNILSVYKKVGSDPLQQTELNLYGSSMLGTVSEQTVATTTITLSGGFGNAVNSIFTRGEKDYHLTDQRGNNMVSITDRRQQISTNGTTVSHYLAEVRTASFYSAFGAISHSYNSSAIKYGFNGQRRSTEISATAQTAEFWEYNGDVGRRWNVDPVVKDGESPYAAFANNPISFVDIDGADTSKPGSMLSKLDDVVLGGAGKSQQKIQMLTVGIKNQIEEIGNNRSLREKAFADMMNSTPGSDEFKDNVEAFNEYQAKEETHKTALGILAGELYKAQNLDNNIKKYNEFVNSYIDLANAAATGANLTTSLVPIGTATSILGSSKNFSISLTTKDGFLFGGITIKAPFNIPIQRFGNMNLTRPDFWGLRIGTSKFANRTFAAIKPSWNPLTQYTTGIIPKGTTMRLGIIGPQGLKYPGGSLQFIIKSKDVINQSTKIIPR